MFDGQCWSYWMISLARGIWVQLPPSVCIHVTSAHTPLYVSITLKKNISLINQNNIHYLEVEWFCTYIVERINEENCDNPELSFKIKDRKRCQCVILMTACWLKTLRVLTKKNISKAREFVVTHELATSNNTSLIRSTEQLMLWNEKLCHLLCKENFFPTQILKFTLFICQS